MIRLRRLLAGTTVLTLLLMLLGVYTAAAGAGLTCQGRWPFCDGYLGLFPANWRSFIEWFHRLVAMVTGFVILGTAGLAWRRGADRRVRLGLLGAVVLLPIQILLGAVTVTFSGLIPGGYAPPVQAAHFLTALTIFGLLAAATAISYAPVEGRRRRQASLAAVAFLPPMALSSFGTLSRFGIPLPYTPKVQILHYGIALSVFALAVAVVVWAGAESRGQRLLSGLSAALVGFQMLLGRRLLGAPDPLLTDTVSLATAACLLGAVWLAYRADDAGLPIVGARAGR